ncbi:MAG: translation initiation factor IF-2, partial [Phycisphaeraceae bacterium]|nr:translation initiation factor IF-2 [Phycisphaeraceae bacterium]
LNPVEWGGETEVVKVSAETGDGVTELLEIVDYQAELLELKADYGGPARGRVIETEMQEGRGPVARVLVQEGELNLGDFIVIGRAFGRVRDMTDERGESIKEAGPATPLELSGIDNVPDAGDKFFVTKSLQKAEEVANHYRETEREQQLASRNKVTLDNLAEQLAASNIDELRVVLKADVQGSIDVLRKSLSEMATDEVAVRVLHAAVGGITESDVLLADASDAVIIGFHVVANPAVRDLAEEREVEIRTYQIIYNLTDDVKKGLEGMLEPESREEEVGTAAVREIFNISGLGTVAGCLVTDGAVERGKKVRVIRDDVVVTDDRQLASLRRVKDDVKEVRAGTECGIRIEGFDDVKPGDTIVCYETIEVKRTLE